MQFESENWSFLAPLILLGLAYSVYAGALWSSVPYCVKANTLGTAFGLCTAVQNIGLTLVPFLIGTVLTSTDDDDSGDDKPKPTQKEESTGYINAMIILAALAGVGVLAGIWLYIDDIKNRGGQLNNVA